MTVSFEVFPPKQDKPLEPLMNVLNRLYTLQPDFISCTYGANGTNAGRHMEICKAIRDSGKTVPISHFTCIGSTREDIKKQMEKCLLIGVNHILALRGDIPAGWEGTRGDFSHASELISVLRQEY